MPEDSRSTPAKPSKKQALLLAVPIAALGWMLLLSLVFWSKTLLAVSALLSLLCVPALVKQSRKYKSWRRSLWAEAAEALEFQLEPGRRRLRMSGWCDGLYCEVYRQRIGWGDSPPMYVCVHVNIRLPEELNIDTRGPLPHDRLSSQLSVGSPSFHKLVRVWGDASAEPVVRSWLDDEVQAYLSDILTRSRLRVRIHKGSLVGRRIDEAKYKVDADDLALIVRQTVELGRLLQASQQDTS